MNKSKIDYLVRAAVVLVLVSLGPRFGYSQPRAISYALPQVDPEITVDIYKPDKAYSGTTLFADLHKTNRIRVIEVNMSGEIVWQYLLPKNLMAYTNPGFDAEIIDNGNLLMLLPLKGVYEINREGKLVWRYLNKKLSHDADRLANGNTLVVWGGGDSKNELTHLEHVLSKLIPTPLRSPPRSSSRSPRVSSSSPRP